MNADKNNADRPLRVVYLGMRCAFSVPPLHALLHTNGIEICAVMLHVAHAQPESQHDPIRRLVPAIQLAATLPVITLSQNGDIAQIAAERGIPVFEVRRIGSTATLAALRELQPDLGCVACFARRLPERLLALPPLGFLNVHPSLLPVHRGPAPLFWTLRDGDATAGVTVHRMDAGLDTGEFVAQEALMLPDGVSEYEADRLCATVGARLLVAATQALRSGTLTSRPQPAGGSYEPWPLPSDFTISTTWSARRAFNFMRGTAAWGLPYAVEVAGQRLMLTTALEYDADGQLDAPVVRLGDCVRIQCTPGALLALVGQETRDVQCV